VKPLIIYFHFFEEYKETTGLIGAAFGINKGVLTELIDDNRLLLKFINEDRICKSNR